MIARAVELPNLRMRIMERRAGGMALPCAMPSFSRTRLRISSAERIGRSLRLLLQCWKGTGHSDLSGKRNRRNDLLQEGKSDKITYEKRYIRRDGSVMWSHVTVSAIRDSAGYHIRSIGTIEDISERKKAEQALRESEQRYRNLFESMDEGFASCEMIYDESDKAIDFRYLDMNPAFSKLTGLIDKQIVGRTVKDLIPGIEPFWIETYDRIVRSGRSERIDNPVSGLNKHYEVYAWRTGDKRFAAVFSDVTAHKQMEDELRLRAFDLTKANTELQSAIKELEGFSYNIAHDLRTPLRSLASFSEIIKDEYGDKLDDQGKNYLDRIHLAGIRMGERIEELLEFSRVRNVNMQLSNVDLSEMAINIVKTLKQTLPSRNVEFKITGHLVTEGDAVLLYQVIKNLLGNAWKFTSKIKSAVIEFGVTEIDRKQVFFVKDNGAGFDMEFKDRLFLPFSRLHTIIEFPGSGIGLAITKRIIERHGGSIWAEGTVGKGAVFFFTLK